MQNVQEINITTFAKNFCELERENIAPHTQRAISKSAYQ